MFGIHEEINSNRMARHTQTYPIMRGYVIDADDPQQKGRLRVCCPKLGDNPESLITDSGFPIPWATYVSPFAGATENISRGPNRIKSPGELAYGLWAIPTIGARVIIALIDNDIDSRVWIGCEHGDNFAHTMPHGRYFNHDEYITGPYTSTEDSVYPLKESTVKAFGTGYEYNSRGADYTVAAIPEGFLQDLVSEKLDQKDSSFTLPNGTIVDYNQGYGHSRDNTTKKDSQTVSLVSPGFHALSMDDRAENCRIRIRTTTGHQIILDDSNERILINTSGGKSFIEMDSNGNIDIHAERHLSFHSMKDMSFTTDGKMRFRAQDGIHMISATNDIRLDTSTDVNIVANNIRAKTATDINFEAGAVVNIKTGSNINIESGAITNIKAGSNINIEASSVANVKGNTLNLQGNAETSISGGSMLKQTAAVIHLNGPAATPAESAEAASVSDSKFAHATIRVPFRLNGLNQAWSRGMLSLTTTDSDTSRNTPDYYRYENFEFPYDSELVGKFESGTAIPRGPNWHR